MVVQIRNKKHQEFVRNVLANENDTKVKIFCGNNVGVSLKRYQLTVISSILRSVCSSVGPCTEDLVIHLPDFSEQSVRSLKKLSDSAWTDCQLWSVEDLTLFQHLGIGVSVSQGEYGGSSPDILIDDIIEDDPAQSSQPAKRKNLKVGTTERRDHAVSAVYKDKDNVNNPPEAGYPLYEDEIKMKKSVLGSEVEEESVINKIVSFIQRNDSSREQVEHNSVRRKSFPQTKKIVEGDEKETDPVTIFREVSITNPEPIESDEDDDDEDLIQRTLILQQDFSDDDESDEDSLDYTELHRARDMLRKELGLSDDEED